MTDLIEEQGYTMKIDNNICSIHYMYEEEENNLQIPLVEGTGKKIGQKEVVTEHNQYLEDYFESIDPKDECSLINGLEDLNWNREDALDYVDDAYLCWNGSLYALKVNSFTRFLSFMNILKKDNLVYKNWEVFSKRFIDLVKWFYCVYLNHDILDNIPPVVGEIELNLLSLHKIVENLGGYFSVTLIDKWGTIAQLQGLTNKDDEAVKNCYKKFIDLIVIYHETVRVPWGEKK